MSDELDDLHQNEQQHIQKNSIDLEIPNVSANLGLSSIQTKTPCRNFWTLPCEVSHAAIRLEIANEYGDFSFDPVDYMEIYSCAGYWSANFLVASAPIPATNAEIRKLQDETNSELAKDAKRLALEGQRFMEKYTFPTWEEMLRRRKLTYEERQAEMWEKLSQEQRLHIEEVTQRITAANEKIRLAYESRLKVVGGTRLWKTAKIPVKDTSWIKELYWEVENRYISLFDPRVKIDWDCDYFHEPIADPYLDPTPEIDSRFRIKRLNSVQNLSRYFYIN